jgi:hypothetical protein
MSASISKKDQIVALLTGKIDVLVADRLGKSVVDFRPYLSVTRGDVEEFLGSHPGEAEKYYAEKSQCEPLHDRHLIGMRDGKYLVAWSDHGRTRFERLFATLAEAVADHVLVTHGMN